MEANGQQKYKPIKVIQTINNIDDFDEDKYTKVYMKELWNK